MTYNHTAGDMLQLAATCEKRVSSGTGVALNPAATDMVAKALRFWAEHKPKFEENDFIVCERELSPNDLFTVLQNYGSYDIYIESENAGQFWADSGDYRLAKPEEEAAGHRIDEVQDEH